MANGKVEVLLADQSQNILDIPTLHVVGCNDPYIAGAVALYNMCDQSSAELFDHGKGHTVPRDSKTIHELCDAVERLNSRDEKFNLSGRALNDIKTLQPVSNQMMGVITGLQG